MNAKGFEWGSLDWLQEGRLRWRRAGQGRTRGKGQTARSLIKAVASDLRERARRRAKRRQHVDVSTCMGAHTRRKRCNEWRERERRRRTRARMSSLSAQRAVLG
eukprot:4914516-Pleurochrysis_carterae.AAC.1